jgi:hypothetical protein
MEATMSGWPKPELGKPSFTLFALSFLVVHSGLHLLMCETRTLSGAVQTL